MGDGEVGDRKNGLAGGEVLCDLEAGTPIKDSNNNNNFYFFHWSVCGAWVEGGEAAVEIPWSGEAPEFFGMRRQARVVRDPRRATKIIYILLTWAKFDHFPRHRGGNNAARVFHALLRGAVRPEEHQIRNLINCLDGGDGKPRAPMCGSE